MKKIAKATIAIIIVSSLLAIVPVNNVKAQYSATISIQTFYDDLSPYGQWVDDPEYGYVWIPDAGPGFRPYYTNGHWVMTGYGFMWVSDYYWGWAPFHYGRWVYSSYYDDWVWVPDTIWGPAWVSWRWGDGYCGWAPLGPGISVGFSFGSAYSIPYDWWVFVPSQYCLSTSFYNYRIAPERNVTYIRNTSIVNNTYFNRGVTYASGPRISEVQRATGKRIRIYNVRNVDRPRRTSVGTSGVISFRPEVTKSYKGNSRPKPHSFIMKDEFKRNRSNGNNEMRKNNEHGRDLQMNQPIRQSEQNIRHIPKKYEHEMNQPQQRTEHRQMAEKKTNRQMMPNNYKPFNQPPVRKMEHKEMPQQQHQPMQERRQQPPAQNQRREMPQRHQQMPQQHQQQSNPPQKQNPNPHKKGNGKGND